MNIHRSTIVSSHVRRPLLPKRAFGTMRLRNSESDMSRWQRRASSIWHRGLKLLQQVATEDLTPADFWNDFAPYYARLTGTALFETLSCDFLNATGDVRGQRCLDLGCGPGKMAQSLKVAGAQKVTAVDESPAMIQQAQSLGSSVEFVCRDLLTYLYAVREASVDLVTAHLVLSYDWQRAANILRQVRRVLTPNGRLLMSNPVPGANFTSAYYETYQHGREPSEALEFARFLKYFLEKRVFYFPSRAHTEVLLTRAGFAAHRLQYYEAFIIPTRASIFELGLNSSGPQVLITRASNGDRH